MIVMSDLKRSGEKDWPASYFSVLYQNTLISQWLFLWHFIVFNLKKRKNKQFEGANATAIRICCKWFYPWTVERNKVFWNVSSLYANIWPQQLDLIAIFFLTCARQTIPAVSNFTSTGKWAHGVLTVCVCVTDTVRRTAFVRIWRKTENEIITAAPMESFSLITSFNTVSKWMMEDPGSKNYSVLVFLNFC